MPGFAQPEQLLPEQHGGSRIERCRHQRRGGCHRWFICQPGRLWSYLHKRPGAAYCSTMLPLSAPTRTREGRATAAAAAVLNRPRVHSVLTPPPVESRCRASRVRSADICRCSTWSGSTRCSVVGADPAVTSGYLEFQSGSSFTNASLLGYLRRRHNHANHRHGHQCRQLALCRRKRQHERNRYTSRPGGPGQQNFTYTFGWATPAGLWYVLQGLATRAART